MVVVFYYKVKKYILEEFINHDFFKPIEFEQPDNFEKFDPADAAEHQGPSHVSF